MPTVYSSTKPSLAHRCLNSWLTRRGQKVSIVCTTFMLIIFFCSSLTTLTYYVNYRAINENQIYSIEQAMGSHLMIDCDYFVTPWHLHICENQDTGNPYAWRHFKLLTTDDPNCVDIYERIPCFEENPKITKLKTDDQILPNACPLLYNEAMSNVELNLPPLENLTKELTVKKPLIGNLKGYLTNIVRAADLFMLCPICVHLGCEDNKPNYHKARHGWPYSRTRCTYNCTWNNVCDYSN